MATDPKLKLRNFFESRAPEAERWRARNPYYYRWLSDLLRFFIPPGCTVLEVGSGLGDLLAAVQPSVGVGIDLSPAMAALASRRHPQPNLRFTTGDVDEAVGVRGTFDCIIASDLVGYLDDIQTALHNLRVLCHERTRLVVTQYNRTWEPLLRLGARLGLNQPKPINNWLSANDLAQLLDVAGFEVVTRGSTFLCPKRLGGAGEWVNRTVARLPGVRRLCLVQYFIARPRPVSPTRRFSVSVVVPAVAAPAAVDAMVQRLPSLGSRTEILFACLSTDAAVLAAVASARVRYPARRLRVFPVAAGIGWGAAVAGALAQATGELILLLGSDLSVAPEELTKFYHLVAEGKADVLVGTRLVYPTGFDGLTPASRRYYRRCGRIVSWIIRQHVTDPLCPLKAVRRDDYRQFGVRLQQAAAAGSGQLSLVLSAARRGLKIAEVPVHCQAAAGGPVAAAPAFTPSVGQTLRLCLRWYPY